MNNPSFPMPTLIHLFEITYNGTNKVYQTTLGDFFVRLVFRHSDESGHTWNISIVSKEFANQSAAFFYSFDGSEDNINQFLNKLCTRVSVAQLFIKMKNNDSKN